MRKIKLEIWGILGAFAIVALLVAIIPATTLVPRNTGTVTHGPMDIIFRYNGANAPSNCKTFIASVEWSITDETYGSSELVPTKSGTLVKELPCQGQSYRPDPENEPYTWATVQSGSDILIGSIKFTPSEFYDQTHVFKLRATYKGKTFGSHHVYVDEITIFMSPIEKVLTCEEHKVCTDDCPQNCEPVEPIQKDECSPQGATRNEVLCSDGKTHQSCEICLENSAGILVWTPIAQTCPTGSGTDVSGGADPEPDGVGCVYSNPDCTEGFSCDVDKNECVPSSDIEVIDEDEIPVELECPFFTKESPSGTNCVYDYELIGMVGFGIIAFSIVVILIMLASKGKPPAQTMPHIKRTIRRLR